MIRPCVEALARLSRQADISGDECDLIGAPNEAAMSINRDIVAQAVEAMRADGVTTEQQLTEALREATDEELEALLKRVDEEMPNPFEWHPPTEPFCSFCDKRPSWWAGSTKEERETKGYRRKLVDFENQEVELQYRGRAVCCDGCQAASDEFERTMEVFEPPYEDDPAYNRYCLEVAVARCLGAERWA